MSSSSPEVVITGIGVISPIGLNAADFAQSLREGRCGFRRSELMSYLASPDFVAGEVSEFTESSAKKEHLRSLRKSIKVMCREIQMGVASAIQAMDHAGLSVGDVPANRVGVEFGANLMSSPPEVLVGAVARATSDSDSSQFIYDKWGSRDEGMGGMEPLWLLRYLPNMPGCHIGIALDAQGPNNSITHDEASGGLCIAEAAGIIRRGRADVMLAGVTGTRLHAVKATQYTRWNPIAEGPAEHRCRPLDRNRTGEVVAEAACTLVLETRKNAEARGAKIYGTLLGCGSGCVIGADGQADETNAVIRSVQAAVRNAGISLDEIGHVNVNASGHPERDRFEAQALHSLFGSRADQVPVTAVRSYFGSAASGGSLVELAASLLMLQDGRIPQTLNFEAADEETPLNVVHGAAGDAPNGTFLKTSVTRMGQSSAVVIRV